MKNKKLFWRNFLMLKLNELLKTIIVILCIGLYLGIIGAIIYFCNLSYYANMGNPTNRFWELFSWSLLGGVFVVVVVGGIYCLIDNNIKKAKSYTSSNKKIKFWKSE